MAKLHIPKVRFGSLIKVHDDDPTYHVWYPAVVTYVDDLYSIGQLMVSLREEGWTVRVIDIKKTAYKVIRY